MLNHNRGGEGGKSPQTPFVHSIRKSWRIPDDRSRRTAHIGRRSRDDEKRLSVRPLHPWEKGGKSRPTRASTRHGQNDPCRLCGLHPRLDGPTKPPVPPSSVSIGFGQTGAGARAGGGGSGVPL